MFDLSFKIKFPSSRSVASVKFEGRYLKFVDQIGILEEPSRRIGFPSFENLSLEVDGLDK